MDTARSIVLITCVISILSGVLDALKPDSRFDRQLRLLLSVVFVLAVLTPFAGGIRSLHVEWRENVVASEALSDAMASETIAEAGRNLETALTTLLTEGGVTDAAVKVAMHTNDDNSIDIEQVTVLCSDTETARSLLTECLGEEVRVHVETAS